MDGNNYIPEAHIVDMSAIHREEGARFERSVACRRHGPARTAGVQSNLAAAYIDTLPPPAGSARSTCYEVTAACCDDVL